MKKCKACGRDFASTNPKAEICYVCENALKRLNGYAVPVVHGRWIAVPSSDMMTGKAYKCSECNKMRYGSFMPNYCQNCGAKMDMEEQQ